MRTLIEDITVAGIGLFSGADTTVTFAPGESRGGITIETAGKRFGATIEHLCEAPPHPAFASMPARSTNLALDPNADRPDVLTVEHALAALMGLGITDVVLRMDGPELPIGDGSALLFAEPLSRAATTEREGPSPFEIAEPFRADDGRGGAVITEPTERAELVYHLDYGNAHPLLTAQTARWIPGDTDTFLRDLAPARTFSLETEVRAMQAGGLFTRFTPSDLLVLGAEGPIDNELRFENEPARHKLLDLIGDLALLQGRPIAGRVEADKTGHAHTHALVRALAAQAR